MSGRDRYRKNRAAGIVDRAIATPFAPEDTDELSAAAEVWFAEQYAELLPNGRLRPLVKQIQHNHPRGWHVRVERNNVIATLTIRWTPRDTGRLLQALTATSRSTVYVLVVGEEPAHFRVAGWAWGHQLLASNIDLGHGPVHAIAQEDLRGTVDIMMAATFYSVRTKPVDTSRLPT